MVPDRTNFSCLKITFAIGEGKTRYNIWNITEIIMPVLASIGSPNLGLKYMDAKHLESSCSSKCIKQFTLGNVAYKFLILY